ncbi:MAG: glycosyltransferase family protein [Candidatus Muirbacterium halophilum]|nr:glycosyltransferase family protein [Candidatus Muirbacterium halophilum]
MKILCIIQARNSSTRLPRKVMLKLKDKTVLQHVIERVMKSKYITDLVVATTINESDLDIVKLCSNIGIKVFCGSENDVLDRFYQVAKLLNPDLIVRITSDCPVIDAEIIDKTIDSHIKSKADYTKNKNYPDGIGSEVFSYNVLKTVWKNATSKSDREHVTLYIRTRPNIFNINLVECEIDLYNKRWTLDDENDFKFVKIIYDEIYDINPFFKFHDILKYVNEHPEIEKINQNTTRDEGLLKSLKDENNESKFKEVL